MRAPLLALAFLWMVPAASAAQAPAPDPAIAEVWSKVLFLGGREHIAAAAEGEELAAAWVADNGDLRTSSRLDPSVIWRAA